MLADEAALSILAGIIFTEDGYIPPPRRTEFEGLYISGLGLIDLFDGIAALFEAAARSNYAFLTW
jgi:hypothetical protein